MKRAMIMLLGILVLGSMGWADDAKSSADLASYLEKLQVKLEHTARRANQPSATGAPVVGLRGAKQEPLSKQLYWKGKAGNQPVSPDEVKMFRAAIDAAQAGKTVEATAGLKSFIEKYPKSSLKTDAEETLARLPAAAPPAPAPTPVAVVPSTSIAPPPAKP